MYSKAYSMVFAVENEGELLIVKAFRLFQNYHNLSERFGDFC